MSRLAKKPRDRINRISTKDTERQASDWYEGKQTGYQCILRPILARKRSIGRINACVYYAWLYWLMVQTASNWIWSYFLCKFLRQF
ncbi:MAG: hypothetical protein OER87_19915, partial [Gammaproteobacteria bacterium]|nr:hypothetical protein [Gammaproteobacteria bacterium]